MDKLGIIEMLNRTCTNKDTEYSVALPLNTLAVIINARSADIRWSRYAGVVQNAANMPYQTQKAATKGTFIPVAGGGLQTLYVATGSDGAVVEILALG